MPLPKEHLHLIFGLIICFLLGTYTCKESLFWYLKATKSQAEGEGGGHKRTIIFSGCLHAIKFPDNSSCFLCPRVEMFYCLMHVSTVQWSY